MGTVTTMRVLLAGLATASLSAAAAGAGTAAVPSGDTCAASGTGPVYTLHIGLPPGAQQFGFAFAAHGAAITNVVIPGANGNFTPQPTAPNTNGVWLSDSPLPTSNVVTVTTNGTASSLTIVPASSTKPTYLSPIACKFTSATGRQGISFSVGGRAAYSPSSGVWKLVVTIPSAGIVSARQLEPTTGTGGAATQTPPTLVQAHRVGLKSAGKVTLVLHPTAKGAAALRTSSALHVRLHVTFDASDGRSSSKLVVVDLRK